MTLPKAALEDDPDEEARYHDYVAMTKALLFDLRLPLRKISSSGEVTWVEGDPLLIPPGLEVLVEFYDEHGPRHFMESAAAALGFTADQRRLLGSWPAEPTHEYVRTQRTVVEHQQFAVARAIRESYRKHDF